MKELLVLLGVLGFNLLVYAAAVATLVGSVRLLRRMARWTARVVIATAPWRVAVRMLWTVGVLYLVTARCRLGRQFGA